MQTYRNYPNKFCDINPDINKKFIEPIAWKMWFVCKNFVFWCFG